MQTNGAPVFAPVKGKDGVSFVVNTNWDLLRIDAGGVLYLRDDTHWLTAPAMEGPWTAVAALPAALAGLPDDGNWTDARAAGRPEPYPGSKPPRVLVSAVPAELILLEGEPALEDVPGTSLQWAANTETDLFFDRDGMHWYVLLSGRWFRATGLEGPWSFATPDLPAGFRAIPEGAPYYAVRAWVPGTSESAEARLKASIPTTARVEAGSINPVVSYVGSPQFAPIEETALAFATNTAATVIKVESRYFLLQDGVWFVADAPEGPWQLAREIPSQIYDIPASSPLYNVTYVRVYETEPEAVWYGYTSGYAYGFLAWDTLVYGTGWYYPPYLYDWPAYGPIYYPRPVTWGMGAYYNPVRGTYGRYGYAYGPYRGIGVGRAWNPATGGYARAAAAWGPRGSAGFVGAYNPRSDSGGYAAGGSNIYGAWNSAGVRRGDDWARVTAGTGAAGGSTVRWNTSANQGFVHEGRRGDLYAGRDGQVYRNAGEGWQKWESGWQDVARPQQGELLQGGERLQDLPADARSRLQQSGVGIAGGAVGAGAAAALQRGEGAASRDRAGAGPAPSQGAIGSAPARERGPAPQRPTAERPSAQRPSAQRPPAPQRLAPPPLPSNLGQDFEARQLGNQRQSANTQLARPATSPFISSGPTTIQGSPNWGSPGENLSRGSYGGGTPQRGMTAAVATGAADIAAAASAEADAAAAVLAAGVAEDVVEQEAAPSHDP